MKLNSNSNFINSMKIVFLIQMRFAAEMINKLENISLENLSRIASLCKSPFQTTNESPEYHYVLFVILNVGEWINTIVSLRYTI